MAKKWINGALLMASSALFTTVIALLTLSRAMLRWGVGGESPLRHLACGVSDVLFAASSMLLAVNSVLLRRCVTQDDA